MLGAISSLCSTGSITISPASPNNIVWTDWGTLWTDAGTTPGTWPQVMLYDIYGNVVPSRLLTLSLFYDSSCNSAVGWVGQSGTTGTTAAGGWVGFPLTISNAGSYYYRVSHSSPNVYSPCTTNPRRNIVYTYFSGCETTYPYFNCPGGLYIIHGYVRYGRWEQSACGNYYADAGNNYGPYYDVPARCLYNNGCQLGYLNTEFGDPWPYHTKQYFAAMWCA